jgi:two-component system, OmpR family, KDP operon response regulator KdpE
VTKQLILVVDDEAPTRKYVSSYLKSNGYDVLTAEDGTEALKLASERVIDLLLLDIGIPGPDGIEVLTAVRRQSEVPVIMLTARGREADKVSALNQGADDYLTKPFGVEELLARVRAALRRTTGAGKGPLPPYRCGRLEVDFGGHRVLLDGTEVALTPKEYEVIAYLARNAGLVLTHRQILQAVWGPEYGEESDYVWTYIRRIRNKIEPDPNEPRYVLTKLGVGYSMPSSE